jgi:hypothetical protein
VLLNGYYSGVTQNFGALGEHLTMFFRQTGLAGKKAAGENNGLSEAT